MSHNNAQTVITSNRNWRIAVSISSEYWGEVPAFQPDTVRVDAYDDEAHMTLTALEARALAAEILAHADRLEALEGTR